MQELKRHKLTFTLLSPIVRAVMRLKFRFTCDSLLDINGPYFLLCNHVTNYDPIFVGLAAGRQLYFVASEHVLRGGGIKEKALMHFFKPILHTKGGSGIGTAGAMLRCLKGGNSLCLFPEGNRTFDGITMEIPDVTGKIAKKCGATVVTCRIEGGYLTQPRWSKTLRRGRINLRLVNVYSPEETKGMTALQLREKIEQDLHEDAFDLAGEKTKFKGKKLALGMESTIFCCPECKKFSTISSSEDSVKCSCGWAAEYDCYGSLHCSNGTVTNVKLLNEIQRKVLYDTYEGSTEGDVIFNDSVRLWTVGDSGILENEREYSLEVKKGSITLSGMEVILSDIMGLAVYSRNRLSVIHKEHHYEICGDDVSFNALKYLYLYKIIKGKEPDNQ